MSTLRLLTLPPSPHNTKVRLALELKGLDYEPHAFEGFDGRDAIVEASGQPLTPVLIDGDRKVYDSFGIVRYLDANWPEPKLFPTTREGMREVEGWERFALNGVGPVLGMILGQAIAGTDDKATIALADRLLQESAARVEAALAGKQWLVGDTIGAADITVAPFLAPGVLDENHHDAGSFLRFVTDRYRLSPRFPMTRAWVTRVMAHDKSGIWS
ncbi:MAG: glutathione S-transferase family protein [Planctomycetes bacterium]|nr:glutathione S-transferase family protein [Planctomycetota bacterium]